MITLYKIFINMLYVKLIVEYFEILYFSNKKFGFMP